MRRRTFLRWLGGLVPALGAAAVFSPALGSGVPSSTLRGGQFLSEIWYFFADNGIYQYSHTRRAWEKVKITTFPSKRA